MKKALLALAVAGATLSAQADTKLYGHVAYQIRDIDGADEITFKRHAFSESRFGLSFSKKVGGLKVLALQEFGLAEGEGALDARRQAFGFSGGFGKVLLGQYNEVSDSIMNQDQSGTILVNPLASNAAASAVGIGLNGYRGGRSEGLRYYSPKIGGIANINVEYGENGNTGIALLVNTGGFKFNAYKQSRDVAPTAAKAAVADTVLTDSNGDTVTLPNTGTDAVDANNGEIDDSGFIIGYKTHGFSAAYVATKRKANGADADDHSGIKLGYSTGKHNFSISKVEVDRATDPESTGLSYLYKMTKGVQLWAGYKKVEETGVDDKKGLSLGGRVQF